MREQHVDVAIIGAGTAGLVALSQIRRARKSFLLIQDGPYGTTCARVGCMPSKSFIQIANDYHRHAFFEQQGIRGAEHLQPDLPAVMRRVREMRDRFAGEMMRKTDRFGERFVKGRARFLEPTVLDVEGRVVRADRVVIATGSRPVLPEKWRRFDGRIWTSDNFFELETIPSSVAVIGLGVVGVELGQAMARLGVDVVGVARSPHLAGITDPAVLDAAVAAIGGEMTLWRGEEADLVEEGSRLAVVAGSKRKTVDAVLVAVGRRPNVDDLGLENLGTPLREDGVPVYDADTLQVGDLPIFIAGDANTAHPVLHEAWHDGRVAGHNAAAERPAGFKRRAPLHIVFSAPNIAMAGSRYGELAPGGFIVGEVSFEDQERALIRNENVGLLRLYASTGNGRLLGAEMFAPAGEHLAHLLAWSIQRQLTVHDLLAMPIYHPVIEEALRAALEEGARMLRFAAPAQ